MLSQSGNAAIGALRWPALCVSVKMQSRQRLRSTLPRRRICFNDGLLDEIMSLCRRTFVLGALSVPITSVAVQMVGLTGVSMEPARNILLLRDASIPEGAQFIRHWPSGEARVLSFERDVSALLFKQLIPMWRESVAPIAGLTDLRAFFCLSHAAGDYGLRLIYRCVHSRGDGSIRHEVRGSQLAVRQDVIDWPSQTARAANEALGNLRGQALPISELLPSGEAMLVSWLMVPRDHVLT